MYSLGSYRGPPRYDLSWGSDEKDASKKKKVLPEF